MKLKSLLFSALLVMCGCITGCSQTVSISGTGVTPPTPGVTLSSTSINFGDVFLNTVDTQGLQVTSSGTAPLIVTAITVSGPEFSVTVPTLPATLAPQTSLQVSVSFDPTVIGPETGSLTVVSNAYTSPMQAPTVLQGTGQENAVNLTWDAPTVSPDPVVSYNVYRELSGSSVYVLVQSGITGTKYTDTNNILSGQTYSYIVESVDANGVTSAPSNTATVVIP